MIYLSIYLFVFVFTLIVCYIDELKNYSGDDFAWCWGFAFAWFLIWPIYLGKFIPEITWEGPIKKFHKFLKQKYGRGYD